MQMRNSQIFSVPSQEELQNTAGSNAQLCRICLTDRGGTVPLEAPLRETTDGTPEPLSILAALQQVVSQKLNILDGYPLQVCTICRDLLRAAYDFHILFYRSQDVLKGIEDEPQKKAAVDLILGTQKYNLDDILIVEKEEEVEPNFDGFLSNLGTTVSAVFVKRPKITCTQRGQTHNIETKQFEIVESNATDHKCNFCGTVCASTLTLSRHIRKSHLGNPDTPKHLCDICGHTSSSKYKGKEHALTHLGRTFQCSLCPKKFFYKVSLYVHMKSHRDNLDHLCAVCGKGFRHSNALFYHMRMHTNDRRFKCTFCDKRFYMQSTWKRHLRVHTDDRPYRCSFCEKGFRSNGEKRKHELIHTGLRPHKCRYCEKMFSTRYNQRLHHMSHRGQYECEGCHRTFVDMEFLLRHVREKHSGGQGPTDTGDQVISSQSCLPGDFRK